VPRKREKRLTISDPDYPKQWHLHGDASTGHLNVVPVWDQGILFAERLLLFYLCISFFLYDLLRVYFFVLLFPILAFSREEFSGKACASRL
jgi:hypothetical protein